MKKIIMCAVVMVIAFAFTAFGAEWKWIDSNGDGKAECYYVQDDGSYFKNGITPDGYTVDANGAWVQGGQIVTQPVANVTPVGAVVFDNGNVRVTYLGIGSSWSGPTVNFCIENNDAIDYCFQTRRESIDGYAYNFTMSDDIPCGTRKNCDFAIWNSDMQKNGQNINTIKSIKFDLHAFSWSFWDEGFDAPITINVR